MTAYWGLGPAWDPIIYGVAILWIVFFASLLVRSRG